MADKVPQIPGIATALYILTAVTGMVDAIAFLALGHVFTANMTGNVVFLAFAAAGTAGLSVPRSLSALVAFLAGAVLGGCLAASLSNSVRKWASIAFSIEATLLFAATLFSAGFHSDVNNHSLVYAVVLLTAIAMGVRNATVRKLAVTDLTTTVLTLTTTGLAADSFLAGGNNERWRRRIVSIACMFGGAAVGAVLLKHSLTLPLIVATLSTVCAIAAVLSEHDLIIGRMLSRQPDGRQL